MRIDSDGRLHSRTMISAAGIAPYTGREIPQWEQHKLDPRKLYWLLRPKAELQAAAPHFCVPLFDKHPDKQGEPNQIGYVRATTFDSASGRLFGHVIVTSSDAVRKIRSGKAPKGLSAGYFYTPEMRGGHRWDGVMRDIRPDHVALVDEPRSRGCWLT